MNILDLFPVGLGVVVSLGLFQALVNRILNNLRGRAPKLLASVLGLIVLPAALGGLGYYGGPVGLGILGLLGAALIARHVHFLALRYQYRAAPPVERQGPMPSLRRPITTTDLCLTRYVVPATLPPGDARRRLRIAHLSDLHVNHRLPAEYYLNAMQQVNQTQPDLIFLTGDYINDLEFVEHLSGLLSTLRSRLGVFAVLGNHDYWAGAAPVRQALTRAGVEVLGNGWRRLPAENLLLMGCEEPWANDDWQPPVIQKDDLALALSHTADHVYPLSRLGVSAMFCGHYHGGQYCLPYVGSLVIPSRFGQRFRHGHFRIKNTHLFVSAGIGLATPPVRLYCPPDIFIVDLMAGESSSQP